MAKSLSDDEGRLARFGNLTADEKAKIRSEQQAELKDATANRTRPLGSRMLDSMVEMFGHPSSKEATRSSAAEDVSKRQRRYDEAKSRAAMSDEEMAKESKLYGVDRPVKLKDNPIKFKKGGAVSASRRADGIAQRGKTRGKMR